MNVQQISIEDFHYDLPNEKIAVFPLEQRDESRLLIWNEGLIQESVYKNIASHLPENAMMVFNNTKVIHARLLFQKHTGATIEIFVLEPHEMPITQAMEQPSSIIIKCFIGGAGKWTKGLILEKPLQLQNEDIVLKAEIIGKEKDYFLVKLLWETNHHFAAIIELAGNVPLPPYIKRTTVEADHQRYQTIYAAHEGSVAAPTAGLHFTHAVFDALKSKNIHIEYVTLHVGAGTFKPVSSATMQSHTMHNEYIEVSKTFLQKCIDFENDVVAVGTTSVRTLESVYWMGVKVFHQPALSIDQIAIQQWDAYQLKAIDKKQALSSLLEWMHRNELAQLTTTTQLLIAPGYEYKMIHWIVTNFHQPKSTLLLLVAAAIGNNWKQLYEYALENDFRFLSYGDGCLIKTAKT